MFRVRIKGCWLRSSQINGSKVRKISVPIMTTKEIQHTTQRERTNTRNGSSFSEPCKRFHFGFEALILSKQTPCLLVRRHFISSQVCNPRIIRDQALANKWVLPPFLSYNSWQGRLKVEKALLHADTLRWWYEIQTRMVSTSNWVMPSQKTLTFTPYSAGDSFSSTECKCLNENRTKVALIYQEERSGAH